VNLTRDLRQAVRQIRRHPGGPLVIILSLAFAMGVSTSLFSVVNAVWLSPWLVPNADTLRVVQPAINLDEFRLWSEGQRSFSGLAARQGLMFARVEGEPVRLDFVSPNYFDVLETPMLIGRGFSETDAGDASGTTVVLAHGFWQRKLGSDQEIIGRALTIEPSKSLVTVVGVAAPGFAGPDLLRTDLFLPIAAAARIQRQERPGAAATRVVAFGRLRPGVSNRQAQTDLEGISTTRPDREPIAVRATARWLQGEVPAQTRFMWFMMFAGITLITLIACASVSNLLLARGHARRADIALRYALGATRGQIVRQFLLESSLLCLTAAALGLVAAHWLPEALYQGFVNNTSPTLATSFQLTFPVDRRIFAFGLVTSAIVCVAFGLYPALRSSREGMMSGLVKEGQLISGRALLPSLLSYQSIVSVTALAVAALVIRSGPVTETRLMRNSVANLTVVRMDTSNALTPQRRQFLVAQASERLGAMVGTRNVAHVVGQMQTGVSQILRVSPNYFDVLQIAWIGGRTFASSDSPAQVVIVNEAFARRFAPDEILGRVLPERHARLWDSRLAGRQVIGIVRDAQVASPIAYFPTSPSDAPDLIIRGSLAASARATSDVIQQLEPTAQLETVSGLTWIASAIAPSLFVSSVVMLFGISSLFLGAIGLFSFLEFSVQQRTREIGIRRALGAQVSDVIRAVIKPAAWPVFRGLLLGVLGAGLIGFFMRRAELPAGVDPFDWVGYAEVAGLVLVTFALACAAPLTRAIRQQPDRVLRVE
jgi:putative ABC transport system permease protein